VKWKVQKINACLHQLNLNYSNYLTSVMFLNKNDWHAFIEAVAQVRNCSLVALQLWAMADADEAADRGYFLPTFATRGTEWPLCD